MYGRESHHFSNSTLGNFIISLDYSDVNPRISFIRGIVLILELNLRIANLEVAKSYVDLSSIVLSRFHDEYRITQDET